MITEQTTPSNWKLTKIVEVAESIQYGYTESSSKEPIGPKFLRITDIQDSCVDWDNVPYCKIDEDAKKKYLLKEGDLVFARTGATVGKSFLIKGKIPEAVYASYLIRLRFKNGVSEKYIYNFFQSPFYWKQITEGQVGIGQPNVNGTKLGQLKFPYAPYEEQISTALKIEELFSELDKGIEQLKTAQQQLKVYRQSVLKWAFEGKLTRSLNHDSYDLPDEHDLNIAAEDEVEYGKKNALPKGWKISKISNLASVNPKLPNKESINGNLEVQFLPMKLVEEVINKIHLVETKVFKEVQKGSYTPFIDGDVIFAKVTPCMENGKIAVVEKLKNGIGYGSSEFHVVRCSEKLLNKYVFYFLVRDKFRNEAESAMTGAVGLRRVPKQFIENYDIPFPEIEEQKQIVQEIESRLSVADKLEETINNNLRQAEALRQSILKKAFEGRLIQ